MGEVRRILSGALLLTALAATIAGAEVKPHGLFTDGAVLQRNRAVPVWGTAAEGEKVTVSLQGQKLTTTARDGKWMVTLKPMSAGGPYTLTVAGENTVELRNILVGEVWICSGQSNMEFTLQGATTGRQALDESQDPLLHLYVVPHNAQPMPIHEVNGAWRESGPDTAARFSAVGYFFGRDLRRALKVPVGLIETNWGGTPAQAWTSHSALAADPQLQSILADEAKYIESYPILLKMYQEGLEKYKEAAEKAKSEGKEPPRPPRAPSAPYNQNSPSTLYNGMIVPLIPYAIRGAIWYQGESNAGAAYQYQTLFPAMIRNWRADWGAGDFPFLFVQLAPFDPQHASAQGPQESAWAELREAQRLTTVRVPHTGMTVITDVGNETDIHPKDKEPVGDRLALAARALVYGEKIEYSGPAYDSMKIEGDRIALRFKHVGGGLMAKDGDLKGFTIAGEDHKFVEAKAVLEGNTVVVSSPQVAHPVAVRYGWTNFPTVNLVNKESLLASPFRTDDFPMTTQARPH
jgi:sialate O-acetylesterase